jgi:hypothetical protein
MKTQDVKDRLTGYFLGSKWKRLKKYKQDGNVMRDFKSTNHRPNHVFTVNTGPDDERVLSITMTLPDPLPPPPEPEPATAEELSKGYYYKLYTEQECEDWCEIEYPVTHILTIGSQAEYVDDGPYSAQKALDPMLQSVNGKLAHQIELMEGTFELMDGEAAKLEPMLIAAGWQQGGWR